MKANHNDKPLDGTEGIAHEGGTSPQPGIYLAMQIAPSPNAYIPAEERIQRFHEEYGSDLDAGRSLAGIVTATGDFLETIVGREAAQDGMSRMLKPLLDGHGGKTLPESEWRSALNNAAVDCFTYWPLGQKLHDLAAYALYGVIFPCGDITPSDLIEEAVTQAEEFFSSLPVNQWHLREKYGALSDIERLVTMAAGRWALDNGRPVVPAALAALGGVTEGRIRNMMAGAEGRFKPRNGMIPAAQALDWLNDRPQFWDSIWQRQSLDTPAASPREDIPSAEEIVFVPVARDGSIFHPGLHRGGGYAIGPKGSETQVKTYSQALDDLHRMKVPYWRRPNEAGNWGIVRGVRWERLTGSDVNSFAADPLHRLLPPGQGAAAGQEEP